MTPRPLLKRRVAFDPKVTYFKPQGIPLRELEEEIIYSDEIEAMRLKNQGLDQTEIAGKMNISQPTLHRILNSAYQKISRALVEGKSIKIIKR